jgi:hypothetical protein
VCGYAAFIRDLGIPLFFLYKLFSIKNFLHRRSTVKNV